MCGPCDAENLTFEEQSLIKEAQEDDVSFAWVLILLGIMGNPPPTPSWRPSIADVDKALLEVRELVSRGCISVGRLEPTGGVSQAGVPRVRHVAEPLDEVRKRAIEALAVPDPFEWQHSCWVTSPQE